ncbi:MAG: hydroxyphenylacetyl-CoA thioesterase PaaI [Thermodesulfobacteriota bacterium]|nr:hydroxyphenylacetyl-CoA thioesterase PaaI [Thermodesulfobacteriota bacterium]
MEKINNAATQDRFASEVGIRLLDVSPGYAKAEMTITEKHLNGLELAHGGAIFTLADLAFAAASNSHGVDAVAINITMSYFKAARTGTHLTAEAREVSLSRKLGTYNISIINEAGEQIAAMQGTAFRKSK